MPPGFRPIGRGIIVFQETVYPVTNWSQVPVPPIPEHPHLQAPVGRLLPEPDEEHPLGDSRRPDRPEGPASSSGTPDSVNVFQIILRALEDEVAKGV